MSSTDWDEIKRLASDFQRAQLTSTLQRLSEKNCVEIINKLLQEKLLEIYFTSTGKEYITPNQLTKEIKEELYVHRGRINLTELCTLLDVNFNVIEKVSGDIARRDSQIHLILGQLISEDYLDILGEETNEKLQQNGSITIAEVAKTYSLPGEFLSQAICKRLGKIIKGQQDETDPDTIFTEAFVARHQYQIRGVLRAITQPTPVSTIISRFHFQERLFFSISEGFIAAGEVAGTFSGARVASQAVYIPTIYSKAQFDWTESFLKQNGYLEFEALKRLGISDAKSYLKRHFKDEQLTFVPGACVGQLFIDQIDANLDDALANGGLVDVSPFLPSIFSGKVCTDLLQLALNARKANAEAAGCTKTSSSCTIFCDSIVVSEKLLTRISLRLEQLMPSKAQEAIAKGAFKHQLSSGKLKGGDSEAASKNKKEDRRKKATGGKSGGGTQGRETKTKSTKSKHRGRRGQQQASDSDGDDNADSSSKPGELEFLSLEELEDELSKEPEFEDCFEELLREVATHLYHPLTQKFQEVARAAFVSSMSGGTDSRKKTHQQLQEKVLALLNTVRLAEKGLKEFGDETQTQLSKYLLRTHCSEIVNELSLYLADDSQIELKSDKELSPEIRLRIINEFEDDLKKPLLGVHKALSGGSVEQFLVAVDDAIAAVDIIQKKKDNKKDRMVLLNHRSGLVDQLSVSLDAALSLHLACLILFQAVTGHLLLASGKFVPQILSFLKPQLPADFYDLLHEYQGLVIRSLTSKEEAILSVVNSRLEELTPRLKELSVSFKKGTKDRGNSLSED